MARVEFVNSSFTANDTKFNFTSQSNDRKKLIHLRSFLPKQVEISRIFGEKNKYHFWRIDSQTFSKKDNCSTINFEYGIIDVSESDFLDSRVKTNFRVHVDGYNVTKDGYFGEIYLNLDHSCIALVSTSSVCLAHINLLESEDIAKNTFKGYIIRHIHTGDPNGLSLIIKVKWYSNHNNLICILKKLSHAHRVDTYFFVYNISTNLDVPVYKLKIECFAQSGSGDCIGFPGKKISDDSVGDIVDFTFGLPHKNDVWQEYTLYILDQYEFIYIYTPITFPDLNIPSKNRMNMISSTIFHLLNSNSITSDSLSFNFVNEIDLLLSNSSESFLSPRLICTDFSPESEHSAGFLILSQYPLFIFAIITTSGKISVYTSDFSLFPPISTLSSLWAQAIDSVCMYTYSDLNLNGIEGLRLFSLPDYQSAGVIHSPRALYYFSLSFGDAERRVPLATLNYGSFILNIDLKPLANSSDSIAIYSYPCSILRKDEGVSVFVYDCGGFGLKPGRIVLMSSLEDLNLEQLTLTHRTTLKYIDKEIQAVKNEFDSCIAKIRAEMGTSSMVNDTFGLLKSLHLLHSKINKFNNLEKTFYCLLEKADERFKENYQRTSSHIERLSRQSSSMDIEISEAIKRIISNKANIEKKFNKVNASFASVLKSKSYNGMLNYYNNILGRVDSIVAEVIALYLQFQCLECQKIRGSSLLNCEHCTIVADTLQHYKARFNNVS